MAGQLGKEVATVFGLGNVTCAKARHVIAQHGAARTHLFPRVIKPSVTVLVHVFVGRHILSWRRIARTARRTGNASGFDAFAIRRVNQHHARHIAGRHALQRVTAAQLQGVSNASALGIALGKVNHAKRHVAAVNRRTRFALLRARDVKQAVPHMFLVGDEFLKAKFAHRAWRDVAGNLRRLHRDGAAAAAGVVQGYALGDEAIGVGRCAIALAPTTRGQHGGGESFFQWRIAFIGAPSTFEQWLARGVDVERAVLGRQVGVDARIGPLGVDIGAHAKLVTETISHRIFDFQRRKVQALQRAVLRGDFDLEGFFGREPQLPRHLARRTVQVLFLTVHRVRELDQHALRQTAVQIELQHIAPRGAHHHTRTKNT